MVALYKFCTNIIIIINNSTVVLLLLHCLLFMILEDKKRIIMHISLLQKIASYCSISQPLDFYENISLSNEKSCLNRTVKEIV